jgi:hypothetical protein
VPVNDFSFYDHVADMIQLVGAVPERHRVPISESAQSDERQRASLDEYFAMARGTRTETQASQALRNMVKATRDVRAELNHDAISELT